MTGVLSVILHYGFTKGWGSLCGGVPARTCMCSLKKQTDDCMCGGLANTKKHEFAFQPKYGSCGQLKPEVLAGSLTVGNDVTVRETLRRMFFCQ